MTEQNQLALKWVKVSIVCGILGDICYGLAISVPMPDFLGNIVFWSFGPFLIVGAPGIYHFIGHYKKTVSLQIGSLFLMLAGFMVTTMAVVQRAVYSTFLPIKPESSDSTYQAWLMGIKSGDAVQLGLDIVWDIFILSSMIFIAISIFKHPKLGKIISILGVVIGLAGLYLNFSTFPTPPGQAGSFDIGPLAGLWFLALMIMIIINFKWFKNSLEE